MLVHHGVLVANEKLTKTTPSTAQRLVKIPVVKGYMIKLFTIICVLIRFPVRRMYEGVED